MNVVSLHNTEKGDLPNFPYILRKPESLGTEFKTVACSVTGDLLLIDIERDITHEEGKLPYGSWGNVIL